MLIQKEITLLMTYITEFHKTLYNSHTTELINFSFQYNKYLI